MPKFIKQEGGVIPIVVLLSAIGLVAFLVITNIFNFKDSLFGSLYPKLPSKAATYISSDNFGFNAAGQEQGDPSYSSALALTKSAGIGWVRTGACDWGNLMPNDPGGNAPYSASKYNFTNCDKFINNIVNNNQLSNLIILSYATQWCSAAPPVGTTYLLGTQTINLSNRVWAQPCDYTKFYDYVYHVVARYGNSEAPDPANPGSVLSKANGYAKGWMKYYEVGNEPDGNNGMLYYDLEIIPPSGTLPLDFQQNLSAHYAHILKVAHDAIKAADPNAGVVLAGLIHQGKNDPDFLNQILNNPPYNNDPSYVNLWPAGPNFEIMNFHCYCSISGTKGADDKLTTVKNALSAAGVWPKPIWVTETGYGSIPSQQRLSAYSCPSTEASNSACRQQQQANYLNDLLPHFLNGIDVGGEIVKADKVFWSHQLDIPKDTSNFCSYGLIWYGSSNMQCGVIPSPIPSPLPTLVTKTAYTAYKNLITSFSTTPTPTPTVSPTPTPSPTSTPSPIPSPTPSSTVDILKPTVIITNPVNGTTVPRKGSVTISANAVDNIAVTKVEFYINDSLTCIDIGSPYSCQWSVPPANNAKYNIQAKAYDSALNSATNSVTVTSK